MKRHALVGCRAVTAVCQSASGSGASGTATCRDASLPQSALCSSTSATLATAMRFAAKPLASAAADAALAKRVAAYAKTSDASIQRVEGKITKWHFIERCGEIEVETVDPTGATTNATYHIRNAQSFETIMPTQHRTLVGTSVKFTPLVEPDPKDPTRMLRSAVGITMDLATSPDAASAAARRDHAPGTFRGDNVEDLRVTQQEPSQNPPTFGLTDMRAETLFGPGGFLSQGSGPSYTGPRVGGALTKAERRDLGDGMTLEGNMVRVEAPAGMLLQGEVVAWSAIHRSGLIRIPGEKEDDGRDVQYAITNVEAFASAMPSSMPLRGARVQFRPVHLHAVDNAADVVQRGGGALRLGKVLRSLAESIEVLQLPAPPKPAAGASDDVRMNPDGSVMTTDMAKRRAKEERFQQWLHAEEQAPPVAPVGPQYGVITRWSGGQGVIEAATGNTFLIEGATRFATYFDVNAVSVRGAVVEFLVEPEMPRHAVQINILSDMVAAASTGGVLTTVPLANLPFAMSVDASAHFGSSTVGSAIGATAEQQRELRQRRAQDVADDKAEAAAAAAAAAATNNDATIATNTTAAEEDGATASPPPSTTTRAAAAAAPPAIDVSTLPVRTGILVSYCAAEYQGVIKDTTNEERFLLRDTRQDVQDFATVRPRLARGCMLEFRAVGSSGRLATYATLTLLPNGEPVPALDEEELDKTEKPVGRPGFGSGNMDEAVAGPLSMTYWVGRFEKVGANMSEFKAFQDQAMVPGQMPKDAAGNQMPEDLRKTDPWFNDSDKNRKIPGTKHRFSDLMQYNQMGMMDLSHTARDPVKLQAKMKDLEEKVPVEMREKGMAKAREFGPKYLKSIKEAKKRGGEANFNFSG